MRIIYTLIALLFIAVTINAQSKESTDLNSIVDYVTCICVNDALPDINKVTCDNGPLTLSAIPATEKSTIALFNEFQKLKEKTNINDNLRFFTDEVFTDKKQYSKIYAFAERRKLKNIFAPIKSKIEIFIQNKETETNLNPDQSTTELGKLENSATENQDSLSTIDMDVRNNTIPPAAATFYSFNFWSFFSIGLSILSIILFITLYKQKSKLKIDYINKIEKFKRQNVSASSFSQIVLSDKDGNLERKNKDLENKIKDLNAELQNLRQKNLREDTEANPVSETNTHFFLEVLPKPIQEEFYMATPDQNNFDLSSLSNTFKPTQSLYKFTVDNQDKSKASFIFHSDEIGIKDAVNYPHTYLDPVCESQNALNQNAKSINTIKPGIAEKRSDKWVVTTKAKIKYE
ncbi:hypothetical protein [Flavobacterium sp. LB2P53]|uniref:hypothetical protein n=1 Tax=Flavobacterium sp. LB2P53 TaxID=2497481 RepID=UPI000F83F099|nr:hypothetical protein [Flavobacterium sp. LB2P53]RTY67064.1 hypothetical protein EKL95_09800 [Flavobacterium sp. LB2P53]